VRLQLVQYLRHPRWAVGRSRFRCSEESAADLRHRGLADAKTDAASGCSKVRRKRQLASGDRYVSSIARYRHSCRQCLGTWLGLLGATLVLVTWFGMEARRSRLCLLVVNSPQEECALSAKSHQCLGRLKLQGTAMAGSYGWRRPAGGTPVGA
jgi:hypothetical protein